MRQGPLLKASKLSFSYGRRSVLRDIGLEVDEGEMVGLVGPNGTGKTTLLKIIGGALKPDKGAVHLCGVNSSSLRPRDRAKMVAVVSQNATTPPGFTVLDMVLMGRNPHLALVQWEGARDLEVCRRAMELTDTWDFANRLLASLSGGERQRVFVARALAQEAPLLLLDEPTANLDLAQQVAIMDLVRCLQMERDGAVLLAMHDLTLAARYCGRIVMVYNGQTFAQGTPQEVLTSENISVVYRAPVQVIPHPEEGTPVVLPLRRKGRDSSVDWKG